jgi:uncharacterized OB-fold protein
MTLPTIGRAGSRLNPSGVSALACTVRQATADGDRIAKRGDTAERIAFPPDPVCAMTREQTADDVEDSAGSPCANVTIVHIAASTFAQLAPYRMCIVVSNEGLCATGARIRENDLRTDAEVEAAVLLHFDGPHLGLIQ